MADGITTTMTVEWDGAYDVVEIGFGGAGAVAANNAADAVAKVLIVEKAPEGGEGGNPRFSSCLLLAGGAAFCFWQALPRRESSLRGTAVHADKKILLPGSNPAICVESFIGRAGAAAVRQRLTVWKGTGVNV